MRGEAGAAARAAAVGGRALGPFLRGVRARPREGRAAARAQAQARGRGGGWGGCFRKVREASGKGAARWAGPPLYKGGAGAARQLLLRPGAASSRSPCGPLAEVRGRWGGSWGGSGVQGAARHSPWAARVRASPRRPRPAAWGQPWSSSSPPTPGRPRACGGPDPPSPGAGVPDAPEGRRGRGRRGGPPGAAERPGRREGVSPRPPAAGPRGGGVGVMAERPVPGAAGRPGRRPEAASRRAHAPRMIAARNEVIPLSAGLLLSVFLNAALKILAGRGWVVSCRCRRPAVTNVARCPFRCPRKPIPKTSRWRRRRWRRSPSRRRSPS